MKNATSIQGIHCFSSAPFRCGRDVWGGASEGRESFRFPEYLFLTLTLSALQWRKMNGPITLFTDRVFYRYLEQHRALDCWTQVSTALDDFEQESADINHAVFWSASKFYCYQRMLVPFVCVDTDMVVMRPLQVKPDTDLLVTHYESVEDEDSNYVGMERLRMKPGSRFYSTQPEPLGLNMSVCGFFNADFRNRFVSEAVKIMRNSVADYDGKSYALPELLYMEQILPAQIARQEGYRIDTLMDCVWSPKQFRFIRNDPELGEWRFQVLDERAPCLHLWFHKNYIEKNAQAREEYLVPLRHYFQQTFQTEYDRITR